jgi:hypothetical protein
MSEIEVYAFLTKNAIGSKMMIYIRKIVFIYINYCLGYFFFLSYTKNSDLTGPISYKHANSNLSLN